MSLAHLRDLGRHRAFRALLVVRLVGQCADGLLQAGLVGVVLFAPERAASPARIAIGFAVLLLPFMVFAPFAGVLLDRWSRVRALRWANAARAALIALTALATAVNASELLIFGTALIALALNRLVLAALGASLPRTIPPDLLVTGNAVAPTLGTVATVIGGGVGLALRGLMDSAGDAAPFVVASVGFVMASLLTGAFATPDLGPERTPVHASAWAAALNDVRTGAAHISRTAPARRALWVTTAQRVLFGALTVWTIVVIRFLLHGTRSDEEHALAALGSVALFIGIGLVVASLTAPALVRRYGPRGAAVCAMTCAALGCLVPTASIRLGSMLIAWAMVGAGAQALKITVDTTLQRSSPDDLRGRVFIAYDLVFNLAFVLGVTVVAAAPMSLLDGVLVPTVAGVGFAIVAVAVHASSGRQWSA